MGGNSDTTSSWAVYLDERGYSAWPDEGLRVDLGAKTPARRLKAYLTRSCAERIAERYNRQYPRQEGRDDTHRNE